MEHDAARFWQKVPYTLSPNVCWPWQGALSDKGYGLHLLNGRQVAAHRRAWELFHGQSAPDSLLACHSCDFPLCVNPHHVWLDTARANSRDAAWKGLVYVHRSISRWEWLYADRAVIQEIKAEAATAAERKRTAFKRPNFIGGQLRYGTWSLDRVGVPFVDGRCLASRRARVSEPSGLFFQCQKAPAVGRLCKQHAAMPDWRAFEAYITKLESRRKREAA